MLRVISALVSRADEPRPSYVSPLLWTFSQRISDQRLIMFEQQFELRRHPLHDRVNQRPAYAHRLVLSSVCYYRFRSATQCALLITSAKHSILVSLHRNRGENRRTLSSVSAFAPRLLMVVKLIKCEADHLLQSDHRIDATRDVGGNFENKPKRWPQFSQNHGNPLLRCIGSQTASVRLPESRPR